MRRCRSRNWSWLSAPTRGAAGCTAAVMAPAAGRAASSRSTCGCLARRRTRSASCTASCWRPAGCPGVPRRGRRPRGPAMAPGGDGGDGILVGAGRRARAARGRGAAGPDGRGAAGAPGAGAGAAGAGGAGGLAAGGAVPAGRRRVGLPGRHGRRRAGRPRRPGRRRRRGRRRGPGDHCGRAARGRARLAPRGRDRRARRRPALRAVPADRVRCRDDGIPGVRKLGGAHRPGAPRPRSRVCAVPWRGCGRAHRDGRVHAAVCLGVGDGRVLPAGRVRPGSLRAAAALVTFAFGKVSGAALLAGLLLLADRSGSLALASFGSVPAGAARTTAQVLLLAGFAVKVGLVPFQVWMARGYAAAPGPARAVMAGVAVNVGFYGLWRTLAVLGPAPAWLAGLLLVLAGLTAILGIAH